MTGFEAIELQFHNRKAIVHIETPLSAAISQVIQSLIEVEDTRND